MEKNQAIKSERVGPAEQIVYGKSPIAMTLYHIQSFTILKIQKQILKCNKNPVYLTTEGKWIFSLQKMLHLI